jgi:hypothetical protein
MTTYDNSGALFKNDRKEQPKHPDYNGSITIDGREYWLSAWIKEGQKGKFMSLAAKPKEERQERREQPRQQQRGGHADDDVPFAPMGQGRAFLAV